MGLTFLDQLLGTVGAVKEQLHDGGQEGELDVGGLIQEGVQERAKELVRVVNAISVVPDNPDHGGLGLRLIKGVQVLAEGTNNGLVPIRILPEDVLENFLGDEYSFPGYTNKIK